MRDTLDDMIAYMGGPGRQLRYGSDWPLVEMGPYVRFLPGEAAASRAARGAESASDGTPSP